MLIVTMIAITPTVLHPLIACPGGGGSIEHTEEVRVSGVGGGEGLLPVFRTCGTTTLYPDRILWLQKDNEIN
jgi:hypothetical protein